LKFDTIVRGGTVIVPGGPLNIDIGIYKGKVMSWLSDHHSEAERIIDTKGCVIIPGLVDCHVHIREPGAPEKEDFTSGTSAAASAGITTIVVMPNTDPPIDNMATFQEVVDLGGRKSVTDFAIAVDANPSKVSEYKGLSEMGAASFEISMQSFPEEAGVGLLGVIDEVSKVDAPLGVFCVDRWIVEQSIKILREVKGRKDPLAHAEAYPPVSEFAGLARILMLAKASGVRLHVRQVTTRSAINLIRYAKDDGIRLTAEVNPHHLNLTIGDLERLGPVAKMVPPLREREDIDGLWSALRSGILDVVSTDHAPHDDKEKVQGESDIWKAPPGIPGVETLLPLLLNALHKGFINWERMVLVACENPAQIFGLYPQKGTLIPGADADLVIIDPYIEWELESRDILSKAKLTPFLGWKFTGQAVMTMVGGQVISHHRRIVASPGTGKFIHPIRKTGPKASADCY